MESKNEEQLIALLNDTTADVDIISRVDKYLKACCEGCGCENLPEPLTRKDELLYALVDKLSHGSGGAGFVDTKKLNALGSFCTSGYSLEFIQDPNIDTSNVTQFGSLFQGATQLVTAPALNYSKGSSLIYIFKGCRNLETVPTMDLKNCWALDGAFEGCEKLKNISFVEGSIQVNVDFSACTLLTNESLLSILKGIKTSVGWKTLKLPANTESIITSDSTMNDLLTTIRAANWTVSFI